MKIIKKYALLWAILLGAIIVLCTWGAVKYINNINADKFGVDGVHPTLFSLYSEDYDSYAEVTAVMKDLGKSYGISLNIVSIDVYSSRSDANKVYDEYFNFSVVPCQVLVDKNGKLLWASEETEISQTAIVSAIERYCGLK